MAQQNMFSDGKIVPVNIREEMKKCYIDYAMSVIVGRALPDVRDGLKPVHRRILYAMNELGMTPDKPFKKCARIVGEVLGKYHPHGDSSVYEALVRLAQDFNTRYLVVDGHGNFGSVDGDGAAAMRYTEARMHKITTSMLADIDCETVDFEPNFDGSLEEPSVLPVRLPMLLLNGSSGIAVGMATNIPPHNLNEVVDGTIALIDNPQITIEGLMEHIKGPDFPTAATIVGLSDIKQAYETGRGSIKMSAVATIEEIPGGAGRQTRTAIIVTEIPYQVNKAMLIQKIADLVKEQKINGISDIRDESDREGMRIVIELKRDAKPEVVKNNLFKFTQLATTFGVNMVTLCGKQPRLLNLYEVLNEFVEHNCKYTAMEASSEAFFRNRLIATTYYVSAITNVTSEHLNIHGSFENYLDCKKQLFRQTDVNGYSILNKDDSYYEQIREACVSKVLTYGKEEDNTLQIVSYTLHPHKTDIVFKYKEKEYSFESPLLGDFNVYNLACAMLITASLGYKMEEIIPRVKDLKISGRLELLNTDTPYYVMVDYAHTPNGIAKLLNFVHTLDINKSIVVIGQAGERDYLKRPKVGNTVVENASYAIFTYEDPRSEDPKDICEDIIRELKETHNNYEIVIDRAEAIQKAIDLAREKDMVLILGKGNETYEKLKTETIYFNDIEEAYKAVKVRKEKEELLRK